MITAKHLREVLYYDPTTGIFTWLVRSARRIQIGDVAGCKTKKGYVALRIENESYYAHRLAWLYVYDAWPTFQIDHEDLNTSNNRIKNLRDVTRTVNGQNKTTATRGNKLNILGVSQRIHTFRARIVVDKKEINLGHFPTKEQAHAAYLIAKRKYHEGCTI